MPFLSYIHIKTILLFALLSYTVNAFALINNTAIQQVSAIKDAAIGIQLSKKHAWLKLLHIDNKGISYIDDKHFFLSSNGKSNPESELLATIDLLVSDSNIQCQFPQRTQWIKQQLPQLAPLIPTKECQEYLKWRRKLNAHSVTLVLASSYLNSPSSMYGHTFLRFDTKGSESEQGKDLTSYAVNFGATITDGGGIMYAYNGLFGGYPGYFSDGPYYEKVKEYSRFDNRDVWEYHLNFSPEETNKLLAHLWELNGISFDYFFFDENCSYRLLELLEVGRENIDLTDEFGLFAIPVDTIRVTKDANLIDHVIYRASNRSKMAFNIDQLSSTEKDLVSKLLKDPKIWDEYKIDSLPESSRYKIAEVSYQLIRYQNNRKSRNQTLAKHSLFLLRKMHQYSEFAKTETPTTPTRPETGHDTQAISLSAGYQDAAFFDIELRAAYHDLLDNLKGYPLATTLNMGSIKVRYLNDKKKAQLQSFNIVEIASLNVRTQFFKPISWRVKAGLDREWTLGKEKLASVFEGGAGWTVPLYSGVEAFLLGQARLEYNSGFNHNLDIAAGYSTGLLFQNTASSFLLEAQQYHFTQGIDRKQISLIYQLPLGKNDAVRLNVKRIQHDDDDISESSLSYRHYF